MEGDLNEVSRFGGVSRVAVFRTFPKITIC